MEHSLALRRSYNGRLAVFDRSGFMAKADNRLLAQPVRREDRSARALGTTHWPPKPAHRSAHHALVVIPAPAIKGHRVIGRGRVVQIVREVRLLELALGFLVCKTDPPLAHSPRALRLRTRALLCSAPAAFQDAGASGQLGPSVRRRSRRAVLTIRCRCIAALSARGRRRPGSSPLTGTAARARPSCTGSRRVPRGGTGGTGGAACRCCRAGSGGRGWSTSGGGQRRRL